MCACERESEGGRKVGKTRERERLRGRECSSEGEVGSVTGRVTDEKEK